MNATNLGTEERIQVHIFADTRRAPFWVIVAAMLLSVGGTVLLFNSDTYQDNILRPIQVVTNGLCSGTLVHGVIGVSLCVAVLVGLGGLRLRDFGFRGEELLRAVVITVALWIIVAGISVVAALVADRQIVLNEQWRSEGPSAVLGKLLAQVFGNALYEETMFRGLLIAQVYLLLETSLSDRPRWRMTAALVSSQVFFSVSHVPNRLAQWDYGSMTAVLGDQLMLFAMGLFFAWLYLRTRNLFLAVGVHSLANAPTTVFASPLDGGGSQGFVVGITVIGLLLWPFVERARDKSKTAAPE